MSETKKFGELPRTTQIITIAVCAPVILAILALVAIGAGFLWKAVLWAWS